MKSIFLFILLFLSKFSISQDYTYLGPINKSVISKLTTKELLQYAECVSTIGMDGNHLTWANYKTISDFKKNNKFYRGRVVSYDLKKNKFSVIPLMGKSVVPFEQCLFYIKRTKTNTIIKFYNFY